jgi:serine protease
MKTFFLLSLALILSRVMSVAQIKNTTYYWSSGYKIPLEADKTRLVVKLAVSSKLAEVKSRLSNSNRLVKVTAFKNFIIVENTRAFENTSAFQAAVNLGIKSDELLNASFEYKNKEAQTFLVQNKIVYRLKQGIDQSQLNKQLTYSHSKIEENEVRYIIVYERNVDVIKAANELYERGLVDYAHPDFYFPAVRSSDPLYQNQYYLKNTGQLGGTSGIDINIEPAWNISLGTDIKIAVVDDGVEDHEEFTSGSGASRILQGFTPKTGGNGRPTFDRRSSTFFGEEIAGHGVACTGILSASHNTLGVKGVIPNALILPYNIFAGDELNRETPSEVASAINRARLDGASIISNSWNYLGSSVSFDVINFAINDAISLGRGGKGCVVVFSAGNNGAAVQYPANRPNVLTVGAIDKQGRHHSYSGTGTSMDVVALSGFTSGNGDIVTTDRTGTLGYNQAVTGNYSNDFGGTSASCPQVAGVAGLILSVNPDLIESEVRNIITETATDMGASGFDNTYGYGRVNAFKAVCKAKVLKDFAGPLTISTSSGSTICSTSDFILNAPNVPGYNITWHWSPSNAITSVSNINLPQVTLRASSNFTGQAEIYYVVSSSSSCEPVKSIPRLFEIGAPPAVPGLLQWNSSQYNGQGCYNAYNGEYITVSAEQPNANLFNYAWTMTVQGGNTVTESGLGRTVFSFNPQFYGSGDSNFELSLVVSNACGSRTYGCGGAVLSSGGGQQFAFTASPNPTQSELTIDASQARRSTPSLASAARAAALRYEIRAQADGSLVRSGTMAGETQRVNLDDLRTGIYTVILYSGDKVLGRRNVVKQ